LFSAAVTAEHALEGETFRSTSTNTINLIDDAKNLGKKQIKLLKRSFGNAKQT
jgi:hypothetical protein